MKGIKDFISEEHAPKHVNTYSVVVQVDIPASSEDEAVKLLAECIENFYPYAVQSVKEWED